MISPNEPERARCLAELVEVLDYARTVLESLGAEIDPATRKELLDRIRTAEAEIDSLRRPKRDDGPWQFDPFWRKLAGDDEDGAEPDTE